MCQGYICSNCGTTAGATTGYADGVWRYWISSTATTSTANTNSIWNGWMTASTATTADTSVTYWPQWVQVVQQRQETRAERTARETRERQQRAEREERDRAYREQQAVLAAERKVADAKAEETMVALLDEEQRQQYAKDSTFFVTSRSGKRYKVTKSWGDNLIRLSEAGEAEEIYCVHIPSTMPVCDNMTAQLLQLRYGDEEALAKVAHRRAVRRAA